jgi:proteasome beta subunit
MGTIVGIRCRDGVVIAGDRLLVRSGRVESRNRQHVYDLDVGVGVAVVGSDVDRFADRLESELRSYRLDRGAVSLAAVERLAGEIADETGHEAVVAARDDDDRATVRGVYTDGATLADPPMAFGSGASLALGGLEAADLASLPLSGTESFVRELFESVAERDPGTGTEVDFWTLADAPDA